MFITENEANDRIINGYKNILPRLYIKIKAYRGMAKKATFIDDEFGEWEAVANSVICKGSNHPKRKLLSSKKIEQNVQLLRPYISINHKSYNGLHKKAVFIDDEFGEWESTPHSVMGGSNHSKRVLNDRILPPEEVQRRILEGWNNIPPRDYIKLKFDTYISSGKKAIFVDSKFGEWSSKPHTIFQGSNHPKRSEISLSPEEVQRRILEGWNGVPPRSYIKLKFNTYINATTKSCFIDIDFGEWWAWPYKVIMGSENPIRSKNCKIISPEEVQRRILKGWSSCPP